MTKIIDGKQLAQQIISEVALEVEVIQHDSGKTPGLAVVLVGDDPASAVYVRNKIKRAKEAGIRSIEHRLDTAITQNDLESLIKQLNQDPTVHGILVQLPLPRHINEKDIIRLITPSKDVDGFHPHNVGLLSVGQSSLIPCTPMGCLEMLKRELGDIEGKHAVVIGRSNIVGKPMASLLLQENCTVTVVHSRTSDIEEVCKEADIIIAAVGIAKLVKDSWVKQGAVIIDVGINAVTVDGKRKLFGDVDFDSVAPKCSAISPVPGGVGPMTIACLMKNTLTAFKQQLSYLKQPVLQPVHEE
ncbi:bifunctional methylenetetrahydrofolate dehydrogenase/methenyltetrahydrofolate cyclohydrolase FolD [Vibrio viridaestus]|uniref:Bifunctional protein FolD n=1 Tax=Vibrio viridaestus TaxID=2487322 RepID=A0A3N9TDN4_9VIBR|nr:bifunctional methylenetetrahydrofolate dehydrogenase/methenyltetrahydrofolate cyclohydrolase FolD [Vibrio viridaestus]RQW62179.1 bifunctional methylenetetrahydrofolate dehydrogenase/methenyltetrahydrofolate cyclohydrolase FolD [Vibrio viridaestus]